MDFDSNQRRMAAIMRDHQEKVVGRWNELVVAGIRGRSSAVEVRHELEDLYSLVIRVMSGTDEQAIGELRAALTELSRSRARNGFTPGETALGIFALKDAVYEFVADAAELASAYHAFSRMIDDLGLLTFETYAATREQIIADQAEAMLELSTPVIRLWDSIIAVPLVGTLEYARHGRSIGGESPLKEEVVLTPSRRQLRRAPSASSSMRCGLARRSSCTPMASAAVGRSPRCLASMPGIRC
jgi:rsbT co-antagonist protein RsbR